MDERKGISRFSVEFLLSHRTEKTQKGALPCLSKFQAAKIFYGCDGLYQVLPSDFVCLTVPNKFVGTLQCFRKFLVSKNFYGFFLSHITKSFPLELFDVEKTSGSEKIGWMR